MELKRLLHTLAMALLLAAALFGLADHDWIVAAQDLNNKIETLLVDRFATESRVDYIIRFAEQADLSPAFEMDWESRGEFVYNALRETADRSQVNAKAILEAAGLRYRTMIGGNDLYVWNGTLADANAIAMLPEVHFILATRTYQLDPYTVAEPATSIRWAGDLLANHWLNAPGEAPNAITDWGILDTKADQAWLLGARGQGIIVANIDTGVQWDHPALQDSFACANGNDPNCWADPSNICGGTACDNNGHGTHTMGTMVANDDPALAYIAGMAPDASWIACKGCESTSCSSYALMTCGDWILAPNGNPSNRPNVVNNSWGGGGGNAWYLSYVQAWVADGIFPAFSAGNSTGCGSMGSPGDYQESFATTGHTSARVHVFSQGPSTYGHDPYTKPNVTAPAAAICSTVPTNGWNCGYSGTSMASPHSAGAVAQAWSICPDLRGQVDLTFQLLQNNADAPDPANPTCGVPEDNQGTYEDGYGYLNILTAATSCIGGVEPGTLEGYVYDQSSSPVEGASVIAQPIAVGNSINAITDPSGYYSMDLAEGIYDVTASKANYKSQTVNSIQVLANQVTTQDFTLTYLGAWTLIPRNATCPDWTRYDAEYYGGLIYFMGGRGGTSGGDTYGNVLTYDPQADTCTDTGAVLPEPVSNYTINLVNDGNYDLLCVFGGRLASGSTTLSVQCYNPSTNLVEVVTNLPAAYTGFTPGAQVVINNLVYIFGGFRSTSAPYELARTDQYNPVANTFTQLGDLSLARAYINAAVVDGKIYAFGGTVFDGASLVAQTRAEVMADPSGAGTWDDAAVADLPTATAEGRAYGFDTASTYELAGKIVIAGGGQWPGETYEAFSYDVTADTYDYDFPNLNDSRRDQAGVFVPGAVARMWVFGGRTGGIDTPPYANPEYFDVGLTGPLEPDIDVTPVSIHADLYPGSAIDIELTINNNGSGTLDWNLTDDAGWLSENPASGLTPAGGTSTSLATIDASGLTPGPHSANLDVNSNDPDEPIVVVPVTLDVLTPEPDILVTAPALEMTLYHDETDTINFTIENNGNADLVWSVTDGAAWLSELPTGSTIIPGDGIEVVVTFDSFGLPAGVYQTDVLISSNDPDEPLITLPATLTVIEPDIIITSPPLELGLFPGETGTISFTIENVGSADLDWSATDDAAWLSELPVGGTILPGDSSEVVVTFDASGLTPGDYTGLITITSNDPDASVVTLDANLTVNTPQSDMAVVKTADPAVNVEESIAYSLTVTNNGPQATTGVEVVDNLPAQVEFVSASAGCSEMGGVITCDVGDLSPDQMAIILIDVIAIDGGIATNSATVTSENLDPYPNNNTGTAETIIHEADIVVTAPPLDMILSTNETGMISFTITNDGDTDLLWTLIESPMVDWLSEQPEGDTLEPGGSSIVEVTYNAQDLTQNTYFTALEISSNDPDAPVILLPVSLTVLEPDLNILAPPLEISLFLNETGFLTMTLQNTGEGNLNWSASDSATWLSEDPDMGTVLPGGSTVVTVTFDSSGLAPGDYDADLVLTSNDPDLPEYSLPASLTVSERQSDLSVSKTTSASSLKLGDLITYTMTISNTGPQSAANVVLTDTLPALVNFVTASEGCIDGSGVVKCEVGDLAAGDEVTITVTVRASDEGVALNKAEVASDTLDPDLTHNIDTVSVTISPKTIQFFLSMVQRH